jgi:hypothetical protein
MLIDSYYLLTLFQLYIRIYTCSSESNARLLQATNVGAGRPRMCEERPLPHCLVHHHITGHLVFVLVITEILMMCPAIDNPASCEIRDVIGFLRA